MPHILLVDDDRAICRTLNLHFQQNNMDVTVAHSAEDGINKAENPEIDAVISDVRLPGADGMSLLSSIKAIRPTLPVIMITAFHDFETTVAAMQGGAIDYVPKPIDLDELDAAVERALSQGRSGEGLVIGGTSGGSGTQIVGQSFAMKEVFKSIGLVAQSRITALILGESGTGKELAARAVHNASAERHLPFVAVNCAALVETLLESEMFGHERGAFTGAVSAHKGKVEQVGEGTLFLDEIAELSMPMQSKLLRILEEREYTPVGGTQVKKSSARFITATNVDLRERVANGLFREDLYYRLNVATITLPPLRDRPSDIRLLVEFLLRKINKDLRKTIRRVSADALTCLEAYGWPGNVRELENVLMKAAVLQRGDLLTPDCLPPELRREPVQAAADGACAGVLCSLRDLERDHIRRVLAETHWHKGKACDILGISRPRLERRIKEFGMVSPRSRSDDED
ncbi:Response regulator of zinc sigma-54-dependent two-component system [Paramagnetospirillum magnetotacticum MS-1]|uniref:DNA-binding transcriptional regulator NtrC n=1 Tax=Paramagnetospirillum magnetotacticum MS-1 TaxID=272627 RepID=A0A0C2UV41_PARME|nr:sigma-54 dependent transcriptional regulator [Paramagnetospirillum magnetotacticum]KIL96691.1 Response regulator of zinc sigma-54-dependent two-component system [Paramagnetospirillum magnetotacticum MS-1]